MADEEVLPQTTLRDTIEAAMEQHSEPPADPVTPEAAPAEAKPEGDDRPRGPDGKFIPKAEAAPKPEGEKPEAKVEPEPVARKPAPKSWKREYLEHYEKLDPKLADYIHQRESEYATGVSTYRQEYERVRPIAEAIAPFMPKLQEHGIEPGQWISNLGRAHEVLATGAPDQKLGMFLKLARDYNVPVQQLFTQAQDGKVYYNPQVAPYQPPQPQVDIRGIVQEQIATVFSQQQIQQFEAARDAAGNPAHPHYEEVRSTMAQLLEAGLADDLESAYVAALNHPRHAQLAQADRQQREAADKAEAARKAAEQAQRARRTAVSPRSATPAGAAPSGKKGSVRSAVADAFEQHADGRV